MTRKEPRLRKNGPAFLPFVSPGDGSSSPKVARYSRHPADRPLANGNKAEVAEEEATAFPLPREANAIPAGADREKSRISRQLRSACCIN